MYTKFIILEKQRQILIPKILEKVCNGIELLFEVNYLLAATHAIECQFSMRNVERKMISRAQIDGTNSGLIASNWNLHKCISN